MQELEQRREAARKSGDSGAWRAVLALAPADPEAHFQLGNRAMADADPATAVAHYRQARAAAPAVAAVAQNLATALAAHALAEQDAGRHEAAAAAFREALSLTDSAIVRNNLALSLLALGRAAEAIDLLRGLDEPATRRNLAQGYEVAGRHEAARATWQAIVDAAPADAVALAHLFHAKLQVHDWADLSDLADALRRAIATEPCPALPLFALQGLDLAPDLMRRAAAAVPQASPLPARPVSDGRLTIGYLSPDLRGHSVGRSLAPVFQAHDRTKVRVVGYAVGDAAPEDLGFDRLVELRHKPPDDVAAGIAADGVDILVDLAGPTRGGAPEVLARRPAPIQAHWFGYGGSLGGLVDYLISDAVHMPEPDAVVEAVVHLPGSFFIAPRPAVGPATRADHGLPDGPVLMNLNAPYKTQPAMFAAWLEILRRRPDSVLWLLDPGPQARARLQRIAGPLADRLVFAPPVDHATHLARQALADVALDTCPHGGGVSTLDALAAGVPVVTLTGPTPASRTGASILAAAGVPGLICDSVEDYIGEILAMLEKPTPVPVGPLFDATAKARHLEAAYATMAARHRAGLGPASFAVPALL
jgi:predicted O-linked N-acetylglucosamine transferase (SPINDLY family)